MDLKKKIFGKKSTQNILEEIYVNQKKRDGQITGLIQELQPMMQDLGDATVVVPLIKSYLDIAVKNDKYLIDLVNSIRNLEDAQKSGDKDAAALSAEELSKLLNNSSLDIEDLE